MDGGRKYIAEGEKGRSGAQQVLMPPARQTRSSGDAELRVLGGPSDGATEEARRAAATNQARRQSGERQPAPDGKQRMPRGEQESGYALAARLFGIPRDELGGSKFMIVDPLGK